MLLQDKIKVLVRPIYKKMQHLFYRTTLQRNLSLKDKFVGKRIIILGDGSSLNEIDLTRLDKEYTFGSNFLMMHKDFKSLDLKFYAMIASWRTAKKSVKPPTGNVEKGLVYLDKLLRNSQTQFFFDVSTKKIITRNQILDDQNAFYVMSGEGLKNLETVRIDLSKPISTLGGSLYFMMAASMYMGFKEIYLCGCGYTYQPIQSGHHYEDWVKTDATPVDQRHQIMQDFAKTNNVEIFNVVPDGFDSPVYQKIGIGDLYQKIGAA